MDMNKMKEKMLEMRAIAAKRDAEAKEQQELQNQVQQSLGGSAADVNLTNITQADAETIKRYQSLETCQELFNEMQLLLKQKLQDQDFQIQSDADDEPDSEPEPDQEFIVTEQDRRSVRVAGRLKNVIAEDVREFFKMFEVRQNGVEIRSRNSAFVEFVDEKTAALAAEQMNGAMLKGGRVTVQGRRTTIMRRQKM